MQWQQKQQNLFVNMQHCKSTCLFIWIPKVGENKEWRESRNDIAEMGASNIKLTSIIISDACIATGTCITFTFKRVHGVWCLFAIYVNHGLCRSLFFNSWRNIWQRKHFSRSLYDKYLINPNISLLCTNNGFTEIFVEFQSKKRYDSSVERTSSEKVRWSASNKISHKLNKKHEIIKELQNWYHKSDGL